MFDIRSDQQLVNYQSPSANSGFTSCGLSLSGRILLCGSDDNNIYMWDTLKNTHNGNSTIMVHYYVSNARLIAGTLSGHENRVTSLSVASNGIAVASCSWDQHVRVWG